MNQQDFEKNKAEIEQALADIENTLCDTWYIHHFDKKQSEGCKGLKDYWD